MATHILAPREVQYGFSSTIFRTAPVPLNTIKRWLVSDHAVVHGVIDDMLWEKVTSVQLKSRWVRLDCFVRGPARSRRLRAIYENSQ